MEKGSKREDQPHSTSKDQIILMLLLRVKPSYPAYPSLVGDFNFSLLIIIWGSAAIYSITTKNEHE